MRILVEPPPSSRCKFCSGELRLKLIEPANPALDLDNEVFVCVNFDREQLYAVSHQNRTVGRRLSEDRRCGVDTRSDEERRLVAERRSNQDRRSGLDRRSNIAEPMTSGPHKHKRSAGTAEQTPEVTMTPVNEWKKSELDAAS